MVIWRREWIIYWEYKGIVSDEEDFRNKENSKRVRCFR